MRRVFAVLAVGLLTALPAGAASAAPTQAPGCDIVGAELTWGFKESFRAYIDGSIANGEWTVADGATYDTPDFGFPAESGSLDGPSLAGDVEFRGSVRFTGHGGILDTTIANPVIRFDGVDRAMLLLDVSGPTMEGDPFSATSVPFAEIGLASVGVLTRQGDTVIVDGAPTMLTAEGSAAFPNYQAGTEFDPVTVAITVDEECGIAFGDGLIGDTTPFVVLVLALAGLLVIAVVVIVVLVARQRR